MEIRPARPADVPDVLPMVAKLAVLHEAWDSDKYPYKKNAAQMYGRWLPARAEDPRSVFLVAQREQKLVAFLIGTVETEIPIYRLSEFGFIHDLWVEEAYRHEGVGRQMVMVAIEKFRGMGVKQIRLDTAAANEPARGLFATCGFRASVVEMLLMLEG